LVPNNVFPEMNLHVFTSLAREEADFSRHPLPHGRGSFCADAMHPANVGVFFCAVLHCYRMMRVCLCEPACVRPVPCDFDGFHVDLEKSTESITLPIRAAPVRKRIFQGIRFLTGAARIVWMEVIELNRSCVNHQVTQPDSQRHGGRFPIFFAYRAHHCISWVPILPNKSVATRKQAFDVVQDNAI
jgi:hypothetical protein